jgi:hypothetical protein
MSSYDNKPIIIGWTVRPRQGSQLPPHYEEVATVRYARRKPPILFFRRLQCVFAVEALLVIALSPFSRAGSVD